MLTMATLLHGTMIQNVWIYDMQRRNFLKLLGGIAAVGALPTLAKQNKYTYDEVRTWGKDYPGFNSIRGKKHSTRPALITFDDAKEATLIGSSYPEGSVPHLTAVHGRHAWSAGDIIKLFREDTIMIVTDIKAEGIIGTII